MSTGSALFPTAAFRKYPRTFGKVAAEAVGMRAVEVDVIFLVQGIGHPAGVLFGIEPGKDAEVLLLRSRVRAWIMS